MISLQPAFDVLPAYRPVKFEAFLDSPDPIVIENAVVQIMESGLPIITKRFKSSRNEPSSFPLATAYYFEIDIQKYIQDYLGPFDSLPSTFVQLPSVGNVTNSELFGLFSISIQYEYINPTTGLLELFTGVTDFSNQFNVYVAARQSTAPLFEKMDLDDFVGVPLSINTLFLTKSARILNLCLEDSAFLSVIQPNVFFPLSGYEVNLYDSSDALLSTGQAETLAPAFSAMHTLNTGSTYLAAQTYVVGAPNFADPLLSYYTVTFGFLIITPGPMYFYIAQTEIFTYEVKGKCCGLRDLRVHWMNLLGGTDSYTFNSEKDLQLTASSDRAQRALPWEIGSATPHNASDVGNFKIKSEGVGSYLVVSRPLTNTQATWLLELLTSPKVYVETNGLFIPVEVQDKTQSIASNKGKIKYEIEVKMSNDFIIQRV